MANYSYGVEIFFGLKSLLIDSKGWIFCQLPVPYGVWPRANQLHGHAKASCSPDVKRRPTGEVQDPSERNQRHKRAAAPSRCCTAATTPFGGTGCGGGEKIGVASFLPAF